MAWYRIQGEALENSLPVEGILVVAYKGNRGDSASIGEELGRTVTNAGGGWEIYYEDWPTEAFVVFMDTTTDFRYKSKVQDWVLGTVTALPSLNNNNLVANAGVETGTLASWTEVNTGNQISGPTADIRYTLFGDYAINNGTDDNLGTHEQWFAVPAGARYLYASAWQTSSGSDSDVGYGQFRFWDGPTEAANKLADEITAKEGLPTGRDGYLGVLRMPVPAGATHLQVLAATYGPGGTNNACVDEIWARFDPTDTYWPPAEVHAANVRSRLRFNGVQDAQTVTDEASSPPTWVFSGTAKIDVDVSPFGVGHNSLRMDGSYGSGIYTDGLPALYETAEFGEFTIRMWVKADDLTDARPFFSFGDITANSSVGYAVATASQIEASTILLRTQQSGTDTQHDQITNDGTYLRPGKWHHVVVQRNNRVVTLFLDGRMVCSGYIDGGMAAFTNRFWLGAARVDNVQRAFKGNIADVQIIQGKSGAGTLVNGSYGAAHPIEFTPPTGPLPV